LSFTRKVINPYKSIIKRYKYLYYALFSKTSFDTDGEDSMHFDVFTLFPDMFQGPFTESILKRAQERGLLSIALHDIRAVATDKHHIVDDYPYGGGAGLVMKPEPIFAAIEAVYVSGPIILLTPQGRLFDQQIARTLAQEQRVTLLCGHYEGIDERVRQHLVTDEISIGDYVLTGGELAAMVVVDAVSRLIPGVLGADASLQEESHSGNLLEYPHYTRPPEFRGWRVPDILLSGHHAQIARWRRKESLRRTRQRRPDLFEKVELSSKLDKQLLRELDEEDDGASTGK
jgi:tRNA (guanine37-N1)-methyltransferase